MERVTDKQFWMDNALRMELDTICYNLPRDWDCCLIISGDGSPRTGKSHLAQQIGYYCSTKLGRTFTEENMVFGGRNLIQKAKELYDKGLPHSVLVYDEAREGLNSKKVMDNYTKEIMDFLNECGMYNHLLIVVLPEFFDLPMPIAVNRTYALINVFKKDVLKKDKEGHGVFDWERGQWEYFNNQAKKYLFLNGKKFHNYNAAKRTKFGEFREAWVIDKDKYVQNKLAYLTEKKDKKDYRLLACLKALNSIMSQNKMVELLAEWGWKTTQQCICEFMIRNSSENSPTIDNRYKLKPPIKDMPLPPGRGEV